MSEDEDDEHEGSGCAGVAVATAAALGAIFLLYAISPTFFVLGFWALAGPVLCGLAWSGKWVRSTANPAPPPPPEGVPVKEPQVTLMRDTSHPNRWLILKPSEWLGRTYDDRDES